MKVLFDSQIFDLQRVGGITRSLTELIVNFNDSVEAKISSLYSQNIYARQSGLINKFKLLDKVPIPRKQIILIRTNRSYTKWCALFGNFDVFHPTYYDPYFLDFIKMPFVLTVHDMIHEIFPEQYKEDKTSQNKKLLCQKAAKIIAISHETKKDIIKFLHIPEKKIEVIHHATSIGQILGKRILLPDKFILFVGSRGGYKNFLTFFDAIKSIMHKDKMLNLVCVGGGQFNDEEIKVISSSDFSNRVVYLSLSDEELVYTYKKALLFVYPSLYEGFGLPILESFSCQCPIAISDIPVFKEVAGAHAFYFNPKNKKSITETIEKLLNNDNLRKSKLKRANSYVERFTYQKTASMTAQVYLKCLNNNTKD